MLPVPTSCSNHFYPAIEEFRADGDTANRNEAPTADAGPDQASLVPPP